MEVLGYNFTDSREKDFVNELISIFNVRFIDQKIADVVIDIRKKYLLQWQKRFGKGKTAAKRFGDNRKRSAKILFLLKIA